jgi:hypothetical protein
MNPPINERLTYPPAANANGRVELITAQAREVLNLRRLPAMLTAAQTAAASMASVTIGQLHYWFIESADELVERFEALALREIRQPRPSGGRN